METRAHHLLIGGFVLVFVAAVVGALLWIAETDLHKDVAVYDIYFEDSVAGLAVGGDVRYRGIKVGEVLDIGIREGDPTRARVTVEISGTAIREGDRASLVFQGITGVLFINIEGAQPGSEPLTREPGQPHPVIPSRPSPLSEVFEGVPDLLAKAVVALDNLGQMASAENRQRLSAILANLQESSASLAARSEQVSRLLDGLERTLGDFEAAGGSLRNTLETADELLAGDVRELISEMRGMSRQLQSFLDEAEGVLAENREPLHEFTTRGMADLAAVAGETRLTLIRLRGLLERLEREGAGALLAPGAKELEVEP